MGRAAVRAAVTAYLNNLGLPYVGAVYPARTYISESDYEIHMLNDAVQYVSSPNGSGASIVVNLPTGKRQRRADTGRGAVNDTYIHKVSLEVYFACTSGDPLQAQADHDAIMDPLVVAIRTDPLLGDPSVVWSAGEFDYGVDVSQSEPYTDEEGMTVFIPCLVETEVWEWISGTGV